MNYKKVRAIRFSGVFDPQQMAPWFERYQSYPLDLRLAVNGSAIGVGMEQMPLEKKEQMVRAAIEHELPFELILTNENEKPDYSISIPLGQSHHPILNHQERGTLAAIKINEEDFSIRVPGLREDHLLAWIKLIVHHLKEQLREQTLEVQIGFFDVILKRCEDLKRHPDPSNELVSQVIEQCKEANRRRVQEEKEPICAIMVFETESEEESIEGIGLLVANASDLGFAYSLSILFVLMKEKPILQELALNCLRQTIKKIDKGLKKGD